MIGKVLEGVAEIFRTERLEDLPVRPKREKESFLAWLLRPEKLPPPPAAATTEKKASLWSQLLGSETLPPPPESPAGAAKPSIFKVIFSRETLPRDPAPEKEHPPSGSPRRRAKGEDE